MEPTHVSTELLEDLAAFLEDYVLTEAGLSKKTAKNLGLAVAAKLADYWGGQVVYIPKNAAAKMRRRDSEIYGKFTGDNASALAKDFDLSVQCIYRIIARERNARQQKQCRLTWD